MSRIGNLPIKLPDGVEFTVNGNQVVVKGPKGTLTRTLPPGMTVDVADKIVKVVRPDDERKSRALHGLTRSLLSNMVEGVSKGYLKELEIVGVGYRARNEGGKLVLQLGFSHTIEFPATPGITWQIEGNRLRVVGFDKELVGELAAKIRATRPPEPYKGKGIRYFGETVRHKAGKAGRAVAK
jgi:large subunit ribosomal protein L6